MMTNRSSFTFGLLNPNQVSSQKLSPGMYSLSARSNIPFARLLGQGIDKTFSWGEMVEVPEGQLCTVSNASYHAGDLFINGGCDYDNRPARITVPVPFTARTFDPFAEVMMWVANYPADVRTARRAYLCFDAFQDNNSLDTFVVLGQRYDGSHNTADEATIFGLTGAGYVDIHTIPINTLIGNFPLGHLSQPGDDTRPHTLLTTAQAFIVQNSVTLNITALPNAYYTMEY